MIINSTAGFRVAAKRKLPQFLFDYIDGGSYDERTLRRNTEDLADLALRQRVLKNVGSVDLSTTLFGQSMSMPAVLAPVGLTGMFARRGEVKAARAAAEFGIPMTLSTVSVCSMEEVIGKSGAPIWFQLYVLKDRGFMKDALQRAQSLGVRTLVFTVDMPTPGSRYRDAHSGMSGPNAGARRMWQALTHPSWALDVGVLGRPHSLGNVSAYLGKSTGLADYVGWLGRNFDPSISWSDLEWIREMWRGPMIIKGILDPDDARDAVKFGADGIVISNHGGRQLDGALSSARALPMIADAVKGDVILMADSGIRTGLDIARMIALGADAVMLGRAYVYALAARGQKGVFDLLQLLREELRVAMVLTGAGAISSLTASSLAVERANSASEPILIT